MNGAVCMVLLTIMMASQTSGTEDPVSALALWGQNLELDPRVVTEIEFFDENRGDLGEGYALRLANGVRDLVFYEARGRLRALLEGKCDSFIDVSFPDPGFAAKKNGGKTSRQARDFEKGFVRTEVVAVFETDASPEEALEIYTSPQFRMSVSSRIKRIWDEGEESCIEIDGVKILLSPTLSCNRISELNRRGVVAQHSQVVSNGGDGGYQRVFFKESLKTFVAIPEGLALHYINYTRTVDLGGVSKLVARRKIAGSQEEAINELRRRIAATGSE
jgi:hypothetical protein